MTPRRAIEQDSKDVGLVARAKSRSFLCRYSSVSLVYLVYSAEVYAATKDLLNII